jgi:hypothetical protein
MVEEEKNETAIGDRARSLHRHRRLLKLLVRQQSELLRELNEIVSSANPFAHA